MLEQINVRGNWVFALFGDGVGQSTNVRLGTPSIDPVENPSRTAVQPLHREVENHAVRHRLGRP